MRAGEVLPSVAEVWEWLDDVPDPEIPAISLVDLGIIRDVSWNDDRLEVTVTPTYSGCPATSIINLDIETALRRIRAYCGGHRGEDFFTATMDLVRMLSGLR